MNNPIIDAFFAANDAKLTAPPRARSADSRFYKTIDQEAENAASLKQVSKSLADTAAAIKIIDLMLSICDEPDENIRNEKRGQLQEMQNALRRKEQQPPAANANVPLDANTDTDATRRAIYLS